jgi:serpin B
MLNLASVVALALPLMPASPIDVGGVIAANNRFALDLYHQLRTQSGNVLFSPYSINKTLGMAYVGASGATAREMAAVLHYGPCQGPLAFLKMRMLLNRFNGARAGTGPFTSKPDVELYLAANLWGQRGYGFDNGFKKLLQECYGAGLEETDFGTPDKARKTINAWVEKQTCHKVPELFGPGSINHESRLVLASAIYFKGDWIHAFNKHGTQNSSFWIDANRKVQVPMMNQTATFGYFENAHLQALRMPYRANHHALIVLLPTKRDGLAGLEAALTSTKLAEYGAALREQMVEVAFPKFKMTDGFSLNGALTAMGMKDAFINGQADFSGMNGGRESLYLSAVVHKACLDINEEGTEAAAATGAVVSHTISLPARPAVPVFRADHPFVLAIVDKRTQTILFLGRFVKP